jgi:citrate synthase/2-methylcitrate synthase
VTPPAIRLHPLPVAVMQELTRKDLARASELAGIRLPEFFTEDRMIWLWNYRVKQIVEDPRSADWVVRAVVSVPDGDVVGHAGFHGPPDENGMVEIGYSVVPEFRRRGYAKAIVRLLLERADSEPDVRTVRASISPDNEPSLATIAGFGFTQVGEQWDDEDGLELLFDLSVTATQRSTMSDEIRKGLAGVIADTTAISKVNPETNSLLYRGYPVQQLAEKCTFEEVAYLLWHGELPTGEQLVEFQNLERSLRPLDARTKRIIDELPLTAHPMDVVRTAVSVIGATDPTLGQKNGLTDRTLNEGRAVYLLAQLPAIIAYDQRRRRDQDLVEPRDDLSYSANFLHMTFGEVPDLTVVNAFDVSMILYAEHSFNASTFTARVITSTLSDLYSAVTGAIGALKGSLHGGANEAVMQVFEEVGTADKVEEWLDAALAEKRKIMGFGHRVYKNGDSRVPTMKAALDTLIAEYDRPDLGELYDRLEAAMDARKGIKPNLDYPSGPAYHLIGFDTEMFTPLFVAARITGWTAHIMEQLESNSLIRPLSAYNGPDERDVP